MSEIEILEWMIKDYEKRGGGYSQIKALKKAIECMNTRPSERDDWGEEAFIKFYIDREFPEKEDNVYVPHESVMWVKKFAKDVTTKFKMPWKEDVDLEHIHDLEAVCLDMNAYLKQCKTTNGMDGRVMKNALPVIRLAINKLFVHPPKSLSVTELETLVNKGMGKWGLPENTKLVGECIAIEIHTAINGEEEG